MRHVRGVGIPFVLFFVLVLGLCTGSMTTATTGGHPRPHPRLSSSCRTVAWAQCITFLRIAPKRFHAHSTWQQRQPSGLWGAGRQTRHMNLALSAKAAASAATPASSEEDDGDANRLVWPGLRGTFEECCTIAMETNATLTSAYHTPEIPPHITR